MLFADATTCTQLIPIKAAVEDAAKATLEEVCNTEPEGQCHVHFIEARCSENVARSRRQSISSDPVTIDALLRSTVPDFVAVLENARDQGAIQFEVDGINFDLTVLLPDTTQLRVILYGNDELALGMARPDQRRQLTNDLASQFALQLSVLPSQLRNFLLTLQRVDASGQAVPVEFNNVTGTFVTVVGQTPIDVEPNGTQIFALDVSFQLTMNDAQQYRNSGMVTQETLNALNTTFQVDKISFSVNEPNIYVSTTKVVTTVPDGTGTTSSSDDTTDIAIIGALSFAALLCLLVGVLAYQRQSSRAKVKLEEQRQRFESFHKTEPVLSPTTGEQKAELEIHYGDSAAPKGVHPGSEAIAAGVVTAASPPPKMERVYGVRELQDESDEPRWDNREPWAGDLIASANRSDSARPAGLAGALQNGHYYPGGPESPSSEAWVGWDNNAAPSYGIPDGDMPDMPPPSHYYPASQNTGIPTLGLLAEQWAIWEPSSKQGQPAEQANLEDAVNQALMLTPRLKGRPGSTSPGNATSVGSRAGSMRDAEGVANPVYEPGGDEHPSAGAAATALASEMSAWEQGEEFQQGRKEAKMKAAGTVFGLGIGAPTVAPGDVVYSQVVPAASKRKMAQTVFSESPMTKPPRVEDVPLNRTNSSYIGIGGPDERESYLKIGETPGRDGGEGSRPGSVHSARLRHASVRSEQSRQPSTRSQHAASRHASVRSEQSRQPSARSERAGNMQDMMDEANARVLQVRRREAQAGKAPSTAALALSQALADSSAGASDTHQGVQHASRGDEFDAAITSLLVANENSIAEADNIPTDGSTDWAGNPVPDAIHPRRHPPSTPPADGGKPPAFFDSDVVATPAVLLKSPGQQSIDTADAVLFAGSTSGGGDFEFG